MPGISKKNRKELKEKYITFIKAKIERLRQDTIKYDTIAQPTFHTNK